ARAESRRDGIGSYRRQNQQRQRRLHCQRDREVIPPSGIALLPEQPCRVSVLIVLESDVDAIEKLGCWSVIPGEEVRGPDGEARRRCENRGARGALLRKRDHRRDRRALGSNPRDASKHSRGRKKSERRKFRKRGKTATASRDSSACDGRLLRPSQQREERERQACRERHVGSRESSMCEHGGNQREDRRGDGGCRVAKVAARPEERHE